MAPAGSDPARRDPARLAVVAPRGFATIAAHAPEGVELRRLEGPASLAGAGFVVPSHDTPEVHAALRGLAGLEVVQVLSAGTDWVEEHLDDGVVLCNAVGSRDTPVAEWVLAALLGASTGLLEGARDRRRERWQPRELCGARVLVLGLGSIGRAVAARLAPFGAEVVGVASHARAGVHGTDELLALLPTADHLVVLTPLTDATRGLVGREALAALPDGAVVVNAGRGAVVDTDALTAEVQGGRLRAVLDVTAPEPLPADHPLRGASGTLAITPHVAGDTRPALERAARLAAEQLGRWVRGEPLEHVVER